MAKTTTAMGLLMRAFVNANPVSGNLVDHSPKAFVKKETKPARPMASGVLVLVAWSRKKKRAMGWMTTVMAKQTNC
jgi:hypothetical protein